MTSLGFGRLGCLRLYVKRIVFLLLTFMLLPALLFQYDDRLLLAL
jgi:hypothetical protein